MKRLITLITVIAIIVGFNCIAQAEEIVVDRDNIRIVEEVVIEETREDYIHTIEDMEREIARLEVIRDNAQRKLSLLDVRRDEGR